MFKIEQLFNREANIKRLKKLPVIKTPVMDTLFTNRPQLESPLVAEEDILDVAKTMPLVRRGGESLAVGPVTGGQNWYEPLPVRLRSQMSAADFNNLKVLSGDGREAWASRKTDNKRRSTRMTTEAMCAIATSGTLDWPVQLEGGGFTRYQVAYGGNGQVVEVTPDTLLDDSAAKLLDAFKLIEAFEEALNEEGYGTDLEIWAGKTAYHALFSLIENHKGTLKIQAGIMDQGVNIGDYLVKRRSEKHRDPQTGATAPTVPDKNIRVIDKSAGHALFYCALDDLDAKLAPLPFFVKPIQTKDPSGYRLVSESKPFPVVNPKGIAEAPVVA